MQTSTTAKLKSTRSLTPLRSPLLQRKCACGNSAGLTGTCSDCQTQNLTLQRRSIEPTEGAEVPPLVHELLPIQTKLTIGKPGDVYEQEADRIADRVMAASVHSAVSVAPPRIQCYTGQATGQTGTAPESVAHVLASSGRPLDPVLRQDMEQRFGHDFSQVRVHTDAKATESAHAVSARAYTVGHDIVFAEGHYDPGVKEGRKLLAHELTHTIQQSAFASAAVPPHQPISIESPGTSLEQAADEERSTRLTNNSGALAPIHRIALQRQPAPLPKTEKTEVSGSESLFTIFVADESKRTDKRFARRQAQEDAARIKKIGALSSEDRKLVTAKLRFFEGDAWQTYSQTIRPALVEVTQEEIQMPGDDFSGAVASGPAKPTLKPLDITERFNRLRQSPEYIDNNIKEVNYFTAELAIIHYKDGSTFELGLVPKWMKPPVVEVDYYTPVEDFRKFEDATTGKFGFMVESEMANAPRSMSYQDLLKTYVHYIDFYVEAGTARIVPSRINMLTAPMLCGTLLNSERRYLEQVDVAVQVGLGGTIAIGGYAGAGGLPKGPGVGLGKTMATRVALNPTARTLAREMDSLLAQGGTKTIEVEGVTLVDVAVSRQGNVLAVRRFMSHLDVALRGQGTGTRVTAAFEDAAAEIGRLNGAKTVTIDVGIIINPNWRTLLEARGYVNILTEGKWVKTIKL
jgi:hypothetical protein